jgi:long-chain acyl-CoA synthetase
VTSATLNLASVLEHSTRLTPGRVAITCAGRHLTYAELNGRANQVAHGLRSLGVVPGDRIALSCPNLPWFPVAYFGILKAGAVVVPLNVLLKPREIAYHLRDCEARALLVFEGTPELPMAAMGSAAAVDLGLETLLVMPRDPQQPPDGVRLLTTLMQGQQATFETVARTPDDTAVILYTSGTTGQPKGAELTHANMVSNAVTCYDMFAPALRDVELCTTLITLPLFHSTAQTTQLNAGLYGGYRLVLMPRFDPAAVLTAFAQEQVGLWVAVPTMYWALLQQASAAHDAAAAVRSLRLCASGGAPMPVEVLRGFERTFGARILEGYGLSEASPVVTFNQVSRPSKPGTVGFPLFAVEVRCMDEAEQPVAPGQRGEVVVRGPNVMKGYYRRPEETRAVLRNGWLHTGDIGVFDDEGYLAIVDRKKDLIIRGGMNVYPREIEEVLMTHPDVALCAVVGVPDERLGEEVKAYVVRRPQAQTDEAALIAWCREQIAAYKYPRRVEFRDALPMSATGKVLKRELR